jgi:hypothetical protein
MSVIAVITDCGTLEARSPITTSASRSTPAFLADAAATCEVMIHTTRSWEMNTSLFIHHASKRCGHKNLFG